MGDYIYCLYLFSEFMFTSHLFCHLKLEGASKEKHLTYYIQCGRKLSVIHFTVAAPFQAITPSAQLTQHKRVTALIPSDCTECVFEVPR